MIFAYGTHHIPIKDRIKAFKEANRVLKDGGKIVFHDYAEGSITSRWYSEIIHEFTYTGHDFIHFYKDQLEADLIEAGFDEVNVFYSYDPFIMEGESPTQAKEILLEHLVSLFGLKKFEERYGYNRDLFLAEAESLVRKCSDFSHCTDEEINDVLRFQELTIYPSKGKFKAEMPRYCLMATGISRK